MAFTKDKNLIKYQGKNYQISYDFKSGILETNHPAKNKFIRQTAKRNINSLSNVICLASISDKKLNPFIETMASQAINILQQLADEATMFTDINHYITLAKNNWKYALELEKTYKTEWRNLSQWADNITTLKLNLNELESKWFKIIKNVDFVKHFAGQLEMYGEILNQSHIEEIIAWYNYNKIEISPYLKNKNLLQVIKELEIGIDKANDIGIMNTYQKYKYLETTDIDGWQYQILKSREEFKKEADTMNNCLYRMRYDKLMSNGKSIIIVAIKPNGTRIDIELKPKRSGELYINQKYYKDDMIVLMKDNKHLNEWIDKINSLRGWQTPFIFCRLSADHLA